MISDPSSMQDRVGNAPPLPTAKKIAADPHGQRGSEAKKSLGWLARPPTTILKASKAGCHTDVPGTNAKWGVRILMRTATRSNEPRFHGGRMNRRQKCMPAQRRHGLSWRPQHGQAPGGRRVCANTSCWPGATVPVIAAHRPGAQLAFPWPQPRHCHHMSHVTCHTSHVTCHMSHVVTATVCCELISRNLVGDVASCSRRMRMPAPQSTSTPVLTRQHAARPATPKSRITT